MPRASCTRRPGDTASRRRGRGTPIARTLLPAVRRPPSPGEEPRCPKCTSTGTTTRKSRAARAANGDHARRWTILGLERRVVRGAQVRRGADDQEVEERLAQESRRPGHRVRSHGRRPAGVDVAGA